MTRERADVLSTLTVLAAVLVLLVALAAYAAVLVAAQPALQRADDRNRNEDGPRSTPPEAASTPSSGGLGGATIAGALERRLALAIAKVAVNEASLSNVQAADVALIHQTTLAHGNTHARRLRWLERHSSCVLTSRPLEGRELATNCVWTRHLHDDDAQPEGWSSAIEWSTYVARWRSVRRAALAHVQGRSAIPLPCVEQPTTWGGPMDHKSALRRGLRRVLCHGTANAGYVSARRRRASR